MKICEIFTSLQGEGKYTGLPAFFIRTSGCTRSCSFCDSNYHTTNYDITYEKLIEKIKKSGKKIIIWTGGEPLLQRESIKDIIKLLGEGYAHHLETNGDLLIRGDIETFDFISCSPKDLKTSIKVKKLLETHTISLLFDIKVVTDGKSNTRLFPYATCLMPLTTYNETKDRIIRQKVWDYCVTNNIKYSPRLHIEVWGNKRGV